MPFTVLKKSKTAKDETEVAGEFSTEKEAKDFVLVDQNADPDIAFEYLIEKPPSFRLPGTPRADVIPKTTTHLFGKT